MYWYIIKIYIKVISAKLLLSKDSAFFFTLKNSRDSPKVKSLRYIYPTDTSCAEREPCFRVHTFQGTKREKEFPKMLLFVVV